MHSVARAALLGARGNTGVILSQLIRGAAEELFSRPGQLIDPTLIGAALARAADRAYASVREPAEGTILTVVREMAHRVAIELAHTARTRASSRTRRRPPRTRDRGSPRARGGDGRGIGDAHARAAGRAARRGRRRRRRLRADVIFAGIVAALRGDEPPPLDHHAPARVTHPQHSSGTYRYCTNFAVTGSDLRADRFIEALEELGDSVLVVGDARTLKVHVHTDDPERATAVFAGVGEVSHLDVADMHAQVAERDSRMAAEPAPAGANGAHAAAPAGRSGARAGEPALRCGRWPSPTATGSGELFRSSACTPSTAGRR